MAVIQLPNNWRPRDYQQAAWNAWENGCRRTIEIWHRRAGKDDVSLHKAAVSAHQEIGNYWHMLPEYAQARKAIWNAVNPHTGMRRIDEAFPHEIRENTNDHEMFIRFKIGSTWQVVGSDNFKSLVGSTLKGVVFSEWAKANPGAWAYLAPIMAESGGWADFITTPEGENHAKSMYDMAVRDPSWFAQILTVNDTKAISLEAVEQQRREYHAIYGMDMGDALIEQEYFCSFTAAILGAIYGSEMKKVDETNRICDIDVDCNFPVHTSWDIGRKDPVAIWFYQVIAGEVRIIDFHQSNLKSPAYHMKIIHNRGYHYGNHWLPHDARAKTYAAAGKSIRQQFTNGTIDDDGKPVEPLQGDVRIVPDLSVQDGIAAARAMFPRCYFDRVACAEGMSALRQYKYEWDEDKFVFRPVPRHDWCSHPADAFRMLGVAWKHEIQPKEKEKPVFPLKGVGSGAILTSEGVRIKDLIEYSDRKSTKRTRI